MRARTALIVVGVLVLVLGTGLYVVITRFGGRLPIALGRACEVHTSSGSVALDADQMANAATIAAVGIRRRLPDRAIVVALAAALQESKLENLAGGDRDSVGLFQQRPSQGWGSVEQLRDPRFAARQFYSSLVKVRGWEQMRITDAAQKVQRSAHPEAYEKWSQESTVLSDALGGRVSSAVTCTRFGAPARRGETAALSLRAGLRLDWGDVTTVADSDVVGLVLAAADQRAGWQYAHWLVAHSDEQSVERVRFGDREWSARNGDWRRVEGQPSSQVIAEVYRA